MPRADNPANFYRIEFTAMECAALAELKQFIEEVSPDYAAAIQDRNAFMMNRAHILAMVTNMPAVIVPNGFTEVDATVDECRAVDVLGEGLQRQMQEIIKGARSLPKGVKEFSGALASVRMKCSAAVQLHIARHPMEIHNGALAVSRPN